MCYNNTYERFVRMIESENLVIVDEMKVNLKIGIGYVWVLINLKIVAYVLSSSIKGCLVYEIL